MCNVSACSHWNAGKTSGLLATRECTHKARCTVRATSLLSEIVAPYPSQILSTICIALIDF